jgi:L-amino acid N-acyltransferase YncA
MKIGFRYALPADLENIVATYNSTIASRMVTADLKPVTTGEKLDWFNAHNEDTRPLWVVEENGEYAGWMSLSSFYGRPAYSGTAELSIYVEERFRGMGVGSNCLRKAIAEAPRCRIHTLLGFIFAHNISSLKLFQNHGFERWGHLPEVAEMDGIRRDLVILGRKV